METGFYLLICGGGTVDNRSQPMPYTSDNNSNNGHGLDTISNDHILVAALQRFLTFSSLQMSISIVASNSNSYILHRYLPRLLHSYIIIVYFQPPARLSFHGLGWHYVRFFSDAAFSGLTLSRCLLLFISPSSDPPSFFSHPLHRIAFHPATRPKKRIIFLYFFFFLVSVVSAFI